MQGREKQLTPPLQHRYLGTTDTILSLALLGGEMVAFIGFTLMVEKPFSSLDTKYGTWVLTYGLNACTSFPIRGSSLL